jgi:hypothetical protein
MEGRDAHRFWWGNLKERGHCGVADVDGRIILKWVEGRDVHRFLVGILRGRAHCGDPDVDGNINFKMDGGQRCAHSSGGET